MISNERSSKSNGFPCVYLNTLEYMKSSLIVENVPARVVRVHALERRQNLRTGGEAHVNVSKVVKSRVSRFTATSHKRTRILSKADDSGRVFNKDECARALSRALEATDEELYDAVNDHLVRLIASFVPFRERQTHTHTQTHTVSDRCAVTLCTLSSL